MLRRRVGREVLDGAEQWLSALGLGVAESLEEGGYSVELRGHNHLSKSLKTPL